MFLKGSNSNGYLSVSITVNKKRKRFAIHRLVAQYFLPLIPGKNFVNHKDANKENNDVNNLEWVTKQENMQHAVNAGLLNHERMQKAVLQIDIETGDIIAEFQSIIEASISTGANKLSIGIVCREGRLKSAGGYFWRYKKNLEPPKNGVIIPRFPLYMLTPDGEVFSLKHNIFLSKISDDAGYYSIGLRKNGKKYTMRINRLMMEVFSDLDENLVVNHKDSDRKNNKIENLECCTTQKNAEHAYNQGNSKYLKKEVNQLDKNGNVIQFFSSISEAKKKTKCLHISEVCQGKRKQSGGYKWEYAC